MARTPRLGLIDGSALAYRSYFVFIRNPLINSRGENTSAVYGFANTLTKILREDHPEYVAIAFDTKAPTPRHALYPEYKSTRAKMPDELGDSLPHIRELVDAMNIALISHDGIEADDIIGTLAARAAAADIDVTIYSGDKDFCQLVSDRVSIVRPKGGGDEDLLGPDGVTEWMGVPPARIVDLLALMGDSSDNIPGVPGVGKKTAIKLLEEHGSLDRILATADRIKGKLGERLQEHRDDAELSRRLVTIDTDVDLDVDFDALKPGAPDEARLGALFKAMEITRFTDLFTPSKPAPEVSYSRVTSLASLEQLLPEAASGDVLAIGLETTSGDALEARLVGVAFTVGEGVGHYVALGHGAMMDASDEVNLPLDDVLARIGPVLEDVDVAKVVHDGKFAASVLANHGITLRGVDFDTLLAAYLLEPGKARYAVEDLARQELDLTLTTRAELMGTGKDRRQLWEVEVDRVSKLACEHVDVVLRLRNVFAPRLRELELEPLFVDVEMPLSEVILRMERRGILLDAELFTALSRELTGEMRAREQEIHEIVGREFNVNSPTQLRVILFDELGLPAGRKTKSGASTDSDVLERLASRHPLPGKILEYRQVQKLLSTYVDALPKLVRADTGRLHSSFNQTIAATGRLSSSDPNLQNIPIRTPAGRRIRAGFVAPDRWRLLSADYSQVELRILASISGDSGLREAFTDGVDVHRHTAAAVFGVSFDDVTDEMRAKAKAVNFGVVYGQGPRGLAEALKIPQKDAKAFIESYFERYASVRQFKDDVLGRSRIDGYVTTLLGRRRYLPDIGSEHHQRRAYAERTAVNTVIQGTAADLIKVAMVRIARRMETDGFAAGMLLTVHDELVFEAPRGEEDALESIVREEMEGALDLDVPLVVDAGWGRTWLDAHE